MPVNIDLQHGDTAPAPFFRMVQEALSGLAHNVQLLRLNDTTVRLPAGTDDDRVDLAIAGKLRYRTTNIDAIDPGGVAATHYIWATCEDNNFTGPPDVDLTDYTFTVRITATDVAPSGAGIAFTRLIGTLEWDGSEIVVGSVRTSVGLAAHGSQHRLDGPDPIPGISPASWHTVARFAGIALNTAGTNLLKPGGFGTTSSLANGTFTFEWGVWIDPLDYDPDGNVLFRIKAHVRTNTLDPGTDLAYDLAGLSSAGSSAEYPYIVVASPVVGALVENPPAATTTVVVSDETPLTAGLYGIEQTAAGASAVNALAVCSVELQAKRTSG